MSVTGLGKQCNRIAQPSAKNPTIDKLLTKSSLPTYNLDRTWGGVGLVELGPNHYVNVRELGSSSPNAETLVFIHGLGSSLEYYAPLIQAAGLEDVHRIILYDLEGQGLSPAHAHSTASLGTYVRDLELLLFHKHVRSATLVGWSLGGLIAMYFAQTHPSLVSRLVLLGPGGSPLPEPAVELFTKRAALVREQGMEASGIAKAVATAATSAATKSSKPLSFSAVRQFLISTHPEGYAKGCIALAKSRETVISVESLKMPTLIIAGKDDIISSIQLAESYKNRMVNSKLEVLEDVGHWHILEDLEATSRAVAGFLKPSIEGGHPTVK